MQLEKFSEAVNYSGVRLKMFSATQFDILPRKPSSISQSLKKRIAVNIVIRDHGPGVPEDTLTRIFDPFFRVEEARDSTGGGSGLGLSIAKRAVQVHHGTITAENASPGLRVRLTIPLLAQ